MFSVPIYYGIELLPNAYRSNIKIKTLYSQFLYHTIEQSLKHLFQPDSLYGLGYSRNDTLEELVDNLSGGDIEVAVVFQIVEDKVFKTIKRFIQSDNNEGYGMYEINTFNSPKAKLYTIDYLGDYRILEWEQGRGKPQETPKMKPINLGSSKVASLNTSSKFRVSEKRQSPTLKQFDDLGKDLDATVMVLRARLEDGGYISDEDKELLLEHCPVTIANELERIENIVWSLDPLSAKEQAFLDLHEPYYIMNNLAKIKTKVAKGLELSKREINFNDFYKPLVTMA